MNLAALIFDADGTLADTEETHRQAFNFAFLQLEALHARRLRAAQPQEN